MAVMATQLTQFSNEIVRKSEHADRYWLSKGHARMRLTIPPHLTPVARLVLMASCVVTMACVATVLGQPARADFKRAIVAAVDGTYVFRGIQRAETTGWVQGEVELGKSYAKAWRIEPLGDGDGQYASESRLRAGWRPVTGGGRFEWDLGGQVFRRSSTGLTGADHALEAFAGVDINAPLNPSIQVYYDLNHDVLTTQAGIFQYRSLPRDLGLRMTADVGAVSALSGAGGTGDYAYAQAQADLVRSFLYGVEAFAGVRGSANSRDTLLRDTPRLWIGAGARWTF